MTTDQPKPATEHTQLRNRDQHGRVFNPQDLERVKRGFIAKREPGLITDEKGRFIGNSDNYEFLRDGRDCPDTVNPHLWRHATLNAHHGLFKVAEGVWQVRGYDISNITFIRGATGWVIIDPLTSEHTARAALELMDQHVEKLPA